MNHGWFKRSLDKWNVVRQRYRRKEQKSTRVKKFSGRKEGPAVKLYNFMQKLIPLFLTEKSMEFRIQKIVNTNCSKRTARCNS